jgi:hypothetical protein
MRGQAPRGSGQSSVVGSQLRAKEVVARNRRRPPVVRRKDAAWIEKHASVIRSYPSLPWAKVSLGTRRASRKPTPYARSSGSGAEVELHPGKPQRTSAALWRSGMARFPGPLWIARVPARRGSAPLSAPLLPYHTLSVPTCRRSSVGRHGTAGTTASRHWIPIASSWACVGEVIRGGPSRVAFDRDHANPAGVARIFCTPGLMPSGPREGGLHARFAVLTASWRERSSPRRFSGTLVAERSRLSTSDPVPYSS